jgi:hypothetical protein
MEPLIPALNGALHLWEQRLVPHDGVREWLFGPRYADPRVAGWALMQPAIPFLITCTYLAVVGAGLLLIKGRKQATARKAAAASGDSPTAITSSDSSALSSKPEALFSWVNSGAFRVFIVLHNAALCAVSAYMTYETVAAAYENFGWGTTGFRALCNPVDRPEEGGWTPSGLRLASVLHLHYLTKFYELVDTLIMLLKGDVRRVSFLHVYHHAVTGFPVWYLNVSYAPGGEAWFTCALNSFVHVIMYAHYAAAAMRIDTPFKLYITQMQMVQFVLYIAQSSTLLYRGADCFAPRVPVVQLLFNAGVFLTLFYKYFREESARKAAEKKKAAAGLEKGAGAKDGVSSKKAKKL